uniref:NADH dehydrogenase subunit 3 n=1 Tax=Potamometra berezowskii TaxID=2853721 RepID=UPI001EE057A7|nr:NADH dehydrogenase subunit 3 [Potamometra berezowskii]UJY96971.1 NADH dehydrogenase subunit 3 [Potamometra berezowskii]UJY96984.1 NADH dehydrogenase subunit 3 [Potamometra berezowskii]UJY96997.1 NADH dehydrogenase subunit 3 [Potamometra berezowskii]UJY97010.1 NADH dehydrogenase subunit 3 [Potamometra berezowskii]UJY97023.1 NADH dehydrogenase subunit 3 [Potamometra berezowskii]
MLLTMLTIMLSMMISMMIMMLCAVISKKSKNNREKMTPFECGFDPKSSARMPFSMQFFMIAIIFLIFDVEIIIILPTIKIAQMSSMTSWFMSTSTFIIILIIGLYHEWNNGILEWSN